MAQSCLPKDQFILRRWSAITTDERGIDAPIYEPDISVDGSIQAVPRTKYVAMGLDFKKDYLTIYSDELILGPSQNRGADKIEYQNKVYTVLSENEWLFQFDFSGILAVKEVI